MLKLRINSIAFLAIIIIVMQVCSQQGLVEAAKAKQNKFLLILFDGFRWDYLDRGDLPNFDRFQAQGVRAEYMMPTFPSLSFPGYYTIQTGLFVENHGFIENDMYDPTHDMVFYTDSDENGSQPFWWEQATPLWTSATKSGLRTFVYQWPGCHVRIFGTVPTYHEKYEYTNGTDVLKRNVEEILERFENDEADVGMIYSEYTDIVGHKYGPESEEMSETLKNVDSIIGLLLDGLLEKSLENKVNIVIVSDHGMTKTGEEDVVRYNLASLTSPGDVEMFLGFGATVSIIPTEGKIDQVYTDLRNVKGLNIWKKKDIPENLHYKNNVRVSPILVLADEGYFLEQIADSHTQVPYVTIDKRKFYKGFHGYQPDNFPDMRAVFIAQGPDFIENFLSPGIDMVDVYNLMNHVLGIEGHANNGTWEHVNAMVKHRGSLSASKPNLMKSLMTATSSLMVLLNVFIINLSMLLSFFDLFESIY